MVLIRTRTSKSNAVFQFDSLCAYLLNISGSWLNLFHCSMTHFVGNLAGARQNRTNPKYAEHVKKLEAKRNEYDINHAQSKEKWEKGMMRNALAVRVLECKRAEKRAELEKYETALQELQNKRNEGSEAGENLARGAMRNNCALALNPYFANETNPQKWDQAIKRFTINYDTDKFSSDLKKALEIDGEVRYVPSEQSVAGSGVTGLASRMRKMPVIDGSVVGEENAFVQSGDMSALGTNGVEEYGVEEH